MLFHSFLLQQTFYNDTLFLKWLNIKNCINHFSLYTLFGTLCSMGSFLVHLKINILFYWWKEFLIWPMSYGLVLKMQWIRSQHNLDTWWSDTVIFWGVSNDFASSSPNKIWALGAVKLWLFYSKSIKKLGFIVTQKNMGTCCSDTVIVYSGSFKQLSIIVILKNLVSWCSDTAIVYSGNCKRLSIVTNRNSWNQRVFCVWVGYRLSLNNNRRFII